jgi:hypothetical protein
MKENSKGEPLTEKKGVLITVDEIPLLSGHNCGYRDDDVRSAVSLLKSKIDNRYPQGIILHQIIDECFPVFVENKHSGQG